MGRGSALAELEAAVARANGGRPTTMVVRGDAGIGKTTLLRSFLDRRARHFHVSRCTAHEDTEVPYLMLVPFLDGLGIERHRLSARPPLDAGDAERLLFIDVLDAVAARAATTTVIVTLDDLQWGDPASCRLVDFIASSLNDLAAGDAVRVLLTAVARPDASGRAAPLLDRLSRGPAGRHLMLEGLDETSVAQLARHYTGRRLSPTEARALQELTGGNPLMLELVLTESDGVGTTAAYSTLADQIGRALGGLSHSVIDVLEVAAVHGGPFTSSVPAAVLGRPDVGAALDEAGEKGIVVSRDDQWSFRHPELARHVRLQLGASRRAALHTAIGRVLAESGDIDGDRALLIDGHFRRGDRSVDVSTRVDVAMRAGERALTLGAWSRAMDAYATVGEHFDTLDLDDASRARVALQIAVAATMDNQPDVARPVLDRAIELAAASGDTATWRDAVLRSVRNRLSSERADPRWPEVASLRQIIDSDADDLTRVLAAVALADVAFVSHAEREGRRWSAEARSLAERSNEPDSIALAAYAEGLQQLGSLDVELARDSFRRCVTSGSTDAVVLSWGLVRMPIAELLAGDLGAAATHFDEAIAATRADQRWADQSLAEVHRSTMLAMAGRLPEAEASAERALQLYERTGYRPTVALAVPQLVCVRTMRDRRDGVEHAIQSWSSDDWHPPRWLRAMAASISGEEARPLELGPPRPLDVNTLLAYVARAELAHPDRIEEAGTVAAGLHTAAERGVIWAAGWTVSVPRALGSVTAVLGDVEGAARWLDLAEAAAATSPGELIQVRMQRAALLRLHGTAPDRTAAASLCLRALAVADDIDAPGLARRARVELDAPSVGIGAAAAALLERTIMFTDIVGSTNLNVAVGDGTFLALLDEHNSVLRDAASRNGGTVFHNTGDGYGIWFGGAGDALACAIAIHRSLARAAERHPAGSVRVRIGIAVGTPLTMEGDLFGVDVVRAARLCAQAAAGQIALDARTAGTYDPVGLRCRSLGSVVLKGFTEPEHIYIVDVIG